MEPKEEFAQKLRQYNALSNVVTQGFAEETMQEYVDLKKWLKDNFKPEYWDLF